MGNTIQQKNKTVASILVPCMLATCIVTYLCTNLVIYLYYIASYYFMFYDNVCSTPHMSLGILNVIKIV